VATVHDELRAAGLRLATDDILGVAAECARMARRMSERLVHVVGLLPAGDDVAVPGVAIQLGRALADKRTTPVAVVDAHASWPCARMLATAGPEGSPVALSWLVENLALLTPRSFHAGAMLGQLTAVIRDTGAAFGHLVVDLTGFNHLGEQLAAFDLVEGVALVARGGRTPLREIQRRFREIPDGRRLGVLLTGL
jgi:hypothetical protein